MEPLSEIVKNVSNVSDIACILVKIFESLIPGNIMYLNNDNFSILSINNNRTLTIKSLDNDYTKSIPFNEWYTDKINNFLIFEYNNVSIISDNIIYNINTIPYHYTNSTYVFRLLHEVPIYNDYILINNIYLSCIELINAEIILCDHMLIPILNLSETEIFINKKVYLKNIKKLYIILKYRNDIPFLCKGINLKINILISMIQTFNQNYIHNSFDLIWNVLDNKYLELNLSHSNLKALQIKKLLTINNYVDIDETNLLTKLITLINSINIEKKFKKTSIQMIKKILNYDQIWEANLNIEQRKIHYKNIIYCLYHIEKNIHNFSNIEKNNFIELIINQFNEIINDCVYRWQLEINKLYVLIVNDNNIKSLDLLELEDIILLKLHEYRCMIVENFINDLMKKNNINDIHFHNYIIYQLSERGLDIKDISYVIDDIHKHTYKIYNIQSDIDNFIKNYYSPDIISNYIKKLFESKELDSSIFRNKIIDWLKCNIPFNFYPFDTKKIRIEKWLYEYNFDENYEIKIETINYILLKLHIFRLNYPLLLSNYISNCKISYDQHINFTNKGNIELSKYICINNWIPIPNNIDNMNFLNIRINDHMIVTWKNSIWSYGYIIDRPETKGYVPTKNIQLLIN